MSQQVITTTEKKSSSHLSVILRSPAFVVLWLSEGLSMVGDRLVMVALITLVYDRTGSAGVVGLLMVFKAVPALLLGSLAGVFVDRWNRKWIMVIANLLQGLLVFCLPLAPGIAIICAIYFVMSSINQFFVPARSAAIPDLVPQETLMTANSMFAITIVFALAIGPAIGTWIMEKISLEAPYHALTNAGHITYVEMDGDPLQNLEAFEKIVRHMHDTGVGYGSINHPIDRDPVCGYNGIIGDSCPCCGREEYEGEEGLGFERIRRITGYLVGTVDRFNDAKRAEVRDRVKHGEFKR